MRLWRISKHADLTGEGGRRTSGRWHTAPRRIVYAADHPSSALLEVLVHLEVELEDLPVAYQLLLITVDDRASRQILPPPPPDWTQDIAWSRGIGNAWLASGKSALLGVPSAIMPQVTTWLLNPAHADSAAVRIVDRLTFPLDARLIRGAKRP